MPRQPLSRLRRRLPRCAGMHKEQKAPSPKTRRPAHVNSTAVSAADGGVCRGRAVLVRGAGEAFAGITVRTGLREAFEDVQRRADSVDGDLVAHAAVEAVDVLERAGR